MTTLNTEEARNINGGCNRCSICGQIVCGDWGAWYKHSIRHTPRCRLWDYIIRIWF